MRLHHIVSLLLVLFACHSSPQPIQADEFKVIASSTLHEQVEILDILGTPSDLWLTGKGIPGALHFDGKDWKEYFFTSDINHGEMLYRDRHQRLWLGGSDAFYAMYEQQKWVWTWLPRSITGKYKQYTDILDICQLHNRIYMSFVSKNGLVEVAGKDITPVRLPVAGQWHAGPCWSDGEQLMVARTTATNPGHHSLMVHQDKGWIEHKIELRGYIVAIDGSSWDNIWMVGMRTQLIGKRPFLMHFNGQEFKEYDFYDGYRLFDVAVRSPTEAYAVGAQGMILAWNGQQWRRIASPFQKSLFAVHLSQHEQSFYIGGQRGFFAHVRLPAKELLPPNKPKSKH